MKLLSAILICLISFATLCTHAQHGDLDNTFGNDGIVTTPIGVDGDRCRDIAVQEDGKIVLIGSTNNGTNLDLAILRYNINGTPDNTFGEGGAFSVNLGGDEYGVSVVVLSDGKILTAGTQGESPFSDFLILKFNSDGTIDQTFGTNGIVTTDFGITHDIANNIMINSDGKIIVTGEVKNGDDRDFAIAQYNTDGTPDPFFSGDGKATFDIVEFDRCYSSALQPDDKIILFGHISLAGDQDFATLRCKPDGSLDNSFGSQGIVVTDFNSTIEFGYSVALQQDGKIITSGITNYSVDPMLGVVRYNTDGSLDNTFGTGGKESHSVGPDYEFYNFLAIQSDGKILIAGASTDSLGSDDINLVRLNKNGSLDNTFGINGIVTTGNAGRSDWSESIALQADSKILVGAYANPSDEKGVFAIYRYLSGLNFGIVDFSIQENSLLIYPNPLQESAVLEYTLTNNESINIDLYDISGILVQSFVRSEKRSKGDHKEKLDLDASIPSGSYILTLSNGTGSSSVRVVK